MGYRSQITNHKSHLTSHKSQIANQYESSLVKVNNGFRGDLRRHVGLGAGGRRTLYLYDSLPQPALMTKEELLDAFRKDRGIGKLYFQRGHMYLTGDGELFQLNDADLESFLSTSDYADWRKSKVNRIVSIPLYVLAGGGAVCAGLGFYQFCALIMRSAFSGFFVFLGSAVVTTAFIVPAVVLSVKGRATANRIADGANAPSSAMQLRVGPTPSGVGVCLSF